MTTPTNDSRLQLDAEDEKYVQVTATPPPVDKNGRRTKRIIVCCDGTWQGGCAVAGTIHRRLIHVKMASCPKNGGNTQISSRYVSNIVATTQSYMIFY